MTIFITGTAGFIGFHLAKLLLEQGHTVHGYDGMTDYYDVRLKQARHAQLRQHPQFTATEALLEDDATLQAAVAAARPSAIVHLAAQAGVRTWLRRVHRSVPTTFRLPPSRWLTS